MSVLAYQKLVESEIGKHPFPDKPENLYQPLRYFLSIGGKRTRPSLTMLGCKLFGEPGIKALNAALSIELFHNFTLIHDDIMDEAPLRRGHQTVHEKWNRDIAILSGDVLFTEAYSLLMNYEPQILARLLPVLNRTAKEVCEGQQMDMDFETSDSVTIPEYLEMIRLKTSVLLGAALEMGAIIAGVEEEREIQSIYNFGMNVGLAFQIHDDILDLYADPKKFGKQIGGDIIANKKTFLLLKAYELADATTQSKMDSLQQEKDAEKKVKEMKKIFMQLNVKDFAEQLKEEYYVSALTSMQMIDVPEINKVDLLELAAQLMTRED